MPEMLDHLDIAFRPRVGNEFYIEVATALIGEWRAKGMVQRDDDPSAGTKNGGEGSQWHLPILEVVKGKGTGDSIDRLRVQRNRFGEVCDKESTTFSASRSGLLNHGLAQIKTDDLCPFTEQPFALSA
jgi:hypothetical protein